MNFNILFYFVLIIINYPVLTKQLQLPFRLRYVNFYIMAKRKLILKTLALAHDGRYSMIDVFFKYKIQCTE